MISNIRRLSLSLCITGTFWLAGCATPLPVEPVADSKPVDHPSPMPAMEQATTKPSGREADTEPNERERQDIHEDECVFFALGSSSISHKEKSKIDAIAQRLQENKSLVVTLIGHANDNGSASFNLAVSDGRVIAVAEQLRKHGIQGSQIRKEALGSERTPKSCRSSKCRQKSRRVEMIVMKGR